MIDHKIWGEMDKMSVNGALQKIRVSEVTYLLVSMLVYQWLLKQIQF